MTEPQVSESLVEADSESLDVDGSETRGRGRGRRVWAPIAVVVGLIAVVAGVAIGTSEPDRDLPAHTQTYSVGSQSNTDLSAAQFPPTALAIPGISVDAPVDWIETGADGVLDPPEDVSRVGWWSPGARPAGPGSTVLTAHVDSKVQGPGVFSNLRNVEMGSEVEVTTQGGSFRYVVTSMTEYDKAALPVDLFSISGEQRLVLITCGGTYDSSTGNYEQNVVVTAVPA